MRRGARGRRVAVLGLRLAATFGEAYVAHFAQQHIRDIGTRLALGGEPAALRRMVVLQGLRVAAAGVAVGVAAAFVSARFLTTVVFNVSPADPRMVTAVAVGLIAMAVLACLLPAHRAATVDPVAILREG